jgi:hypothetical protein
MAYNHPVQEKIAPRTKDQIALIQRLWKTQTYSETVERIIMADQNLGPDTSEVRLLLAATRADRRTVVVKDIRMANETYDEWTRMHLRYGYRWYVETLEHMVIRAFHHAGFEPDLHWNDLATSMFDPSRVARAKRMYRRLDGEA